MVDAGAIPRHVIAALESKTEEVWAACAQKRPNFNELRKTLAKLRDCVAAVETDSSAHLLPVTYATCWALEWFGSGRDDTKAKGAARLALMRLATKLMERKALDAVVVWKMIVFVVLCDVMDMELQDLCDKCTEEYNECIRIGDEQLGFDTSGELTELPGDMSEEDAKAWFEAKPTDEKDTLLAMDKACLRYHAVIAKRGIVYDPKYTTPPWDADCGWARENVLFFRREEAEALAKSLGVTLLFIYAPPIAYCFEVAPREEAEAEGEAEEGDQAEGEEEGEAEGEEADRSREEGAGRSPVDLGRHQGAGASQPSGGSQSVANSRGGRFLPLGVKGKTDQELACADRLASRDPFEVDKAGYVSHRHDTMFVKAYGVGNCLLEGMMFATGNSISELGVNAKALEAMMRELKIDPEHGPSMGALDRALQTAKSPFRLVALNHLNADRKWTTLLNLEEGIYVVLALALDEGKQVGHFVVYDAWRDLLVVDPGRKFVVRVEPKDKKDEESARAFLLEHYFLVAPLRVCQLVVAANRVSETTFNTPEHYTDLEAKRAAKLKRKAEREAEGHQQERARA